MASRRLEKEQKRETWHRNGKDQVSAPLIIDPTAGELTANLKKACVKFEAASGICVSVRLRAGRSVKKDVKAEPYRKKECERDNCFCCSTGNPGFCERNSVGYRIWCSSCLLTGSSAIYEGESGRNTFTRGLEPEESQKQGS